MRPHSKLNCWDSLVNIRGPKGGCCSRSTMIDLPDVQRFVILALEFVR